MEKHIKSIDDQIKHNQGKNIFPDGTKFRFIDETIKAFSDIEEINPDAQNILIDYATDKTLEEFCRMNQYYTFNTEAKNHLRILYGDLFSCLKAKTESMETISNNHFHNLRQWLRVTNPFAESLYGTTTEISPVACFEYTPDSQIKVLKIDSEQLIQPVLDIGCGKKAYLVHYLQGLGIETFGIDRFSFTENYLANADWLEYNYGEKQWGTIFSNLGFSNHFKHHHLRKDGNYIAYARKYMEILNALKIGGSFHYAPDLPFIETYLNSQQFKVEKYQIDDFDHQTIIVTRLE